LNFPADLLATARKALGTDQVRLESLLLELERKAQEYRELLAEATGDRDRLQSLVSSYESKLKEVRIEVAELKKNAKSEARTIIKEAQATVERVVREIREQQAASTAVKSARQELQHIKERHSPEQEELHESPQEPLAPGDAVRLEDSTAVGHIEEIRAKSAVVSWSHGTIQVPLAKLRKAKRSEAAHASVPSATVAFEGRTELDLRG